MIATDAQWAIFDKFSLKYYPYSEATEASSLSFEIVSHIKNENFYELHGELFTFAVVVVL